MAKKGSFQFDGDDDLDFGDEMFPLDDDAFGDIEEGGKKGFFKNIAKSVKSLGVDVVNEFLPEVGNLKSSLDMSISDAATKISEMKELAASKIAKSKSNKGALKKEITEIGAEVGSTLKKGRFYKSDSEKSLDISSMMDFDDGDSGDDDSGSGREEEDVSGKMTTKMSSSKKYKPNKLTIQTSNENELRAMEKIQQNAVVANAKLQTRLHSKNVLMNEQNFSVQLGVLKNIATNVYNIAGFLSKEGVTSVKANLEYSAKSLAFMSDQSALLKDLLVTNKKQIGEGNKEDDEAKMRDFIEKGKDPFFMGGFDLSNYLAKVGENAKGILGETLPGQMFGAYKDTKEAMAMGGMKSMSPGRMAMSMAKSIIPSLLLGSKTKEKLSNANTLIEGFGGSLVSRMNRITEETGGTGVMGILGRLLGIDTFNDKSVNMGLKDAKAAVPFDQQSHKTLNTVIPGYLSKIASALTGQEEKYFDYISNTFKANSTKMEEYNLVKKNAMESNIHFSKGMRDIKENTITKSKEYGNLVDPVTLDKSFEKFKENLLDSKMELNTNLLLNNENKEYQNKLFSGISGKNREETNIIRKIITSSVLKLANDDSASLSMLNSGIHSTSSTLTSRMKEFKENSSITGGDLVMADANIRERLESSDFNLKHSRAYNADLNKKGTKAYLSAMQNAAQLKQSEFSDRAGLIDSLGDGSGLESTSSQSGGVAKSASAILTNIYDLLLDGIVVFPSKPSKSDYSRIEGLISRRDELKEEAKRKKEDERKIRDMQADELIANQKRIREATYAQGLAGGIGETGFGSKLRSAVGFDKLANIIADFIPKAMNGLFGEGTTGDISQYSAVEGGAGEQFLRDREEQEKQMFSSISNMTSDFYDKAKKKGEGKGLVAELAGGFTKTVDGSKDFYNKHKNKVIDGVNNAKKFVVDTKNDIKDAAPKVDIEGTKKKISSKIPDSIKKKFVETKKEISKTYYGRKGTIAILGNFTKKRRLELTELINSLGFETSDKMNKHCITYIGSATNNEDKELIKSIKAHKIGGLNVSDATILSFLKDDYIDFVYNYEEKRENDESDSASEDSVKKSSRKKIIPIDNMNTSTFSSGTIKDNTDVIRPAPVISINSSKTDNSVGSEGYRNNEDSREFAKYTESGFGVLEKIGVDISNKIDLSNSLLTKIDKNTITNTKKTNESTKSKVKLSKDKKKETLLSKIIKSPIRLANYLTKSVLKALGKGVLGLVKGIVKAPFSLIGAIGGGVFEGVKGLGTGIIKGVKNIGTGIKNLFTKKEKEEKAIDKELIRIKVKIENGKKLTKKEQIYWDEHSDELNEADQKKMKKKGLGFLLEKPKKIFTLGRDMVSTLFKKGKEIVVKGSNFTTRSITAAWGYLRGKRIDEMSDEDIVAYASKLLNKPIDEVEGMPIEELKKIVATDLNKKKPINKLKRAWSTVRSKATGVYQSSRDKLKDLKELYRTKGEEYFNSLTHSEAAAKLSEIMNIPKEELEKMTLEEMKEKLRGFISGKLKLSNIKKGLASIVNKSKSFANKAMSDIKIGSGKISHGNFLLGETRAIRIMLERQYGPVNMEAIMADIGKMSILSKIGGKFSSREKGDRISIFSKMKDKFKNSKIGQKLSGFADRMKNKRDERRAKKEKENILLDKLNKKYKNLSPKARKKAIAKYFKDLEKKKKQKEKEASLSASKRKKLGAARKKKREKENNKKKRQKERDDRKAEREARRADKRSGRISLKDRFSGFGKGIRDRLDEMKYRRDSKRVKSGSLLEDSGEIKKLSLRDRLRNRLDEMKYRRDSKRVKSGSLLEDEENPEILKTKSRFNLKDRFSGFGKGIRDKLDEMKYRREAGKVRIGSLIEDEENPDDKIRFGLGDRFGKFAGGLRDNLTGKYKGAKDRFSGFGKGIRDKLDEMKYRREAGKVRIGSLIEDEDSEGSIIKKESGFKKRIEELKKKLNETKDKYKEGINSKVSLLKEKKNSFFASFKNKNNIIDGSSSIPTNPDGTVEGTYADKKEDKVKMTKEEREEAVYEELKKHSDLLSSILAIVSSGLSADALKKLNNGKTAAGGSVGKIINAASKTMIGLGVAGVAAAAGTAVMLGKKTFDKIKLAKSELKNTTLGEKLNFMMGDGGGANYDSHGEEIDEKTRSTRGFGLKRLRIGTVMGVGKVAGLAGKFLKLISKLLHTGPIVKKLGVTAVDGIVGSLGKTFTKNFFTRASGKIAAFIGKASNPAGWAILAGQTASDFATGMARTSRYFKLGKGIKPTMAMRLTSGVVNVLSGLLFGLIPTETLVNLVYEKTAKASTKEAITKGKEFVAQRAKTLGVEPGRLAEFETRTFNERMFGGTVKAATTLGFAKGKDDKAGIARFKEWRDNKYKPLMELYDSMKNEYGRKVDKVVEKDEDILNQENFRKAYIKASSDYINKNDLKDIGVISSEEDKDNGVEGGEGENSDSKGDESKNTSGSAKPTPSTEDKEPSDAAASAGTAAVAAMSSNSPVTSGSNDATGTGAITVPTASSDSESNATTTTDDATEEKKESKFKSFFKSLGGKAVAAGAAAGSFLVSKLKGARDAIEAFRNRRKETETELDTLFSNKDNSALGKIADKIRDAKALGQQASLSGLNSEFAKRVESFLKDPRVAGKGVKLREGYRSPLTQLAYYSKGRADPKITDMLMKKAGFKSGINFWPKSLQKMGEYITWTLGSNHFNGTAIDLDKGDMDYETLGAIAKEYGIDWGGSWDNPDPPHFEMAQGWKPSNDTTGSSRSSAQVQGIDEIQADATNYNRPRTGSTHRSKKPFNMFGLIGNRSKLNNISNSINKTISNISNKAMNNFSNRNDRSENSTGSLNMTIFESKLDKMYEIALKGTEILDELLNEQKRHNKIAEEGMGNIIKGIMMLGKISAASGGGNNVSLPSTNNLFDALAKGV